MSFKSFSANTNKRETTCRSSHSMRIQTNEKRRVVQIFKTKYQQTKNDVSFESFNIKRRKTTCCSNHSTITSISTNQIVKKFRYVVNIKCYRNNIKIKNNSYLFHDNVNINHSYNYLTKNSSNVFRTNLSFE